MERKIKFISLKHNPKPDTLWLKNFPELGICCLSKVKLLSRALTNLYNLTLAYLPSLSPYHVSLHP